MNTGSLPLKALILGCILSNRSRALIPSTGNWNWMPDLRGTVIISFRCPWTLQRGNRGKIFGSATPISTFRGYTGAGRTWCGRSVPLWMTEVVFRAPGYLRYNASRPQADYVIPRGRQVRIGCRGRSRSYYLLTNLRSSRYKVEVLEQTMWRLRGYSTLSIPCCNGVYQRPWRNKCMTYKSSEEWGLFPKWWLSRLPSSMGSKLSVYIPHPVYLDGK